MKYTIHILIIGLLMFSCIKKDIKSRNAFDLDSLQREQNKMTLINDSTQLSWIVDEYIGFWTPTIDQMTIIDTLTVMGIRSLEHDYNRLSIDSYKDYYRQYICYIQPDGDSIVFINAVCNIWYDPMGIRENWQHDIIIVMDGGDCFWSTWINFSKKKNIRIVVNGMA